jgi:hypothetical protein
MQQGSCRYTGYGNLALFKAVKASSDAYGWKMANVVNGLTDGYASWRSAYCTLPQARCMRRPGACELYVLQVWRGWGLLPLGHRDHSVGPD